MEQRPLGWLDCSIGPLHGLGIGRANGTGPLLTRLPLFGTKIRVAG